MPEPVRFSIIMPAYNRAAFINRAIDSVLAQDYQHWELIIVDDGSTDNTTEAVTPYTGDARIKYLRNDRNRERSYSRNRGLDAATGDYICFLDSDDVYLPGRLSGTAKTIAEIQDKGPLLIFTATLEERDGVQKKLAYPEPNGPPADYILLHLPSINTVTMSRSHLEGLRFNEQFRLDEDLDFFLRASLRYRLLYVAEPTALRYIHETNSSAVVRDFLGEKLEVYRAILKEDAVRRALSSTARFTYLKSLRFRRIIAMNAAHKKQMVWQLSLDYMLRYPMAGRNVYLLKTMFKVLLR